MADAGHARHRQRHLDPARRRRTAESGHAGRGTGPHRRAAGGRRPPAWTDQADEVIIDRNTALRSELALGDTLTLRVTQGTQDEFYDLEVVGITDGQQYSLQPSIFVPFYTWDRVRPKSEAEVNVSNPVANVILVKLDDPSQVETVRQRITAQVENVEDRHAE